uniref:Uncharacterized protein n=1 Tax=Molossus molossus TaxID=27622 RepID=A0A7J8CZ30_MOLMO|nr:hypothetical protein HJG59_009456 [Molossus molossus]
METLEEGEPECLTECPPGLSGGGEGKWSSPAPPCKARQGTPQWGLGPSCTTDIKEQKLKAPARLSATETGRDLAAATLPSSSLSASPDCCDQPCFKHVSIDPDCIMWPDLGRGQEGHSLTVQK